MRVEGHGAVLEPPVAWPPRYALFGLPVSATTYAEAAAAVTEAARARRPACVSALAVHGLMTGVDDPTLGQALGRFDMLTPDGQPVRWALNLLHRARLVDRVYGPELMLRLCARAATTGIGVYLYGSRAEVVERLADNLTHRFPGLRVVGREPSLFRPLSSEEDQALVERVERSGAGILFVGLGCPLQERFADEHRNRLHCVQVCVGAAFDFHAGTKPMAPRWMQRRGLEWLFRLGCEPRRLWRRYLTTNARFIMRLGAQWWRMRLGASARAESPPDSRPPAGVPPRPDPSLKAS